MVGAILAFKPSHGDMQRWVQVNWKKYNPKISHIQPGLYLFELQNEEDKLEVLGRSWSFYHKSPVTLKEWDPNMDFENINFNKIPVWVQLPNLRSRFWPAKSLSKLVSYIGMPVATDPLTMSRTRLGFARLLVEVDVQGPLPEAIPITGPNGEKLCQLVRYEFIMPKCTKCHMTGHDVEFCRKKQDQTKVPNKEDKKVDTAKSNEKDESIPLKDGQKHKSSNEANVTVTIPVSSVEKVPEKEKSLDKEKHLSGGQPKEGVVSSSKGYLTRKMCV